MRILERPFLITMTTLRGVALYRSRQRITQRGEQFYLGQRYRVPRRFANFRMLTLSYVSQIDLYRN